MKICPNCKSEVEDNFDICWNCQFSFFDNEVLNENDFELVCPACKSEVDPKLRFCPYCKCDLKEGNKLEKMGIPGPVKQINCFRCQIPMSFNGNFKFHEGTRMGAMGDIFELFTNRESFDLYFCPKCGKVEFFLPEVRG